MGCWKCSCGHYVDTEYRKCIFCNRPKPGTVKQGDIEYTVTFLYMQRNKPCLNSLVAKGPVNISTGADHQRLNVTNIVSSGAATEFLSFDWENSIPHGNPLQIWPVAEGGFEIAYLSPSFTANGMEIGSGKVRVESGSILMLSSAMAIKVEDFRGTAFIKGSLSPVGARNGNLKDSDLYFPPGSDIGFLNGLNYLARTRYVNGGAVESKPKDETDWGYVNKAILSMFGIKFRNYRETIAPLEEGRT